MPTERKGREGKVERDISETIDFTPSYSASRMQRRVAPQQAAAAAAAATTAEFIRSRLLTCEAHSVAAPSAKPLQLQVAVFFVFNMKRRHANRTLQGWSFKRFVTLDSVAGAAVLMLARLSMRDAAPQGTMATALVATSLHVQAIEGERVCGGLLPSTWCLPAHVHHLPPVAAACRLCSTATRPRPQVRAGSSLHSRFLRFLRWSRPSMQVGNLSRHL